MVSNSGTLYLVAALGVVSGVILFRAGFNALQRRRLILNTPSSKVRSAALGLVEISGLACGPYTLTAPITGLPCYFYRTTVWQWKQSGKDSEWELAAEESLHVPFYLDDNTGRVLVNPQGAEMDLHCDFEHEYSNSIFSRADEIPGSVYSFLSRNSIDADKRIRIEEQAIKPKNSLFVLGTLAVNPGDALKPTPIQTEDSRTKTYHLPTSGLLGQAAISLLGDAVNNPLTVRTTVSYGRGANVGVIHLAQAATASAGSVATATHAANPEKVAAAMMQAGIVNPAAWAVAGIPFPGTPVAVAGASAVSEQFDLKPATVLMKGDHNPAFFISWKNQRAVLSTLEWKSSLMIWGGPVLTLLSTLFLAARFGLL